MLQINFGKMAKLNISIPTLIPPRECIVKSSRTDFRKLDTTFFGIGKKEDNLTCKQMQRKTTSQEKTTKKNNLNE